MQRLCRKLASLVGFALVSLPIVAASFEEAGHSAHNDLQIALSDLSELQKKIGDEKIPVAKRLNELEEKLVTRRKELERSQREQENQLVDLNVLKAEVKRARDENAFLNSLLTEFGRLFETRIHISEVPRYKEIIEAGKLAAASDDSTPTEKAERGIAVLNSAAGRIETLLGGQSFEGQALTPAGKMESGMFVLLGPVAVFASDKSEAAGLAELQLGSPEPSIIALDGAKGAQIRSFIASGSGELPVDPSSGNAVKIAATKDGFIEHILKGGVVMIPIVLLAIAAAIIAVIKWVQLSKIQVASSADLQTVIDHLTSGQGDRARAHARSVRGPSGELLAIAVDHADSKKELIEEVLYEKMLHLKPRLERLLPFLALTAASAPLLGLLGTVTGMITTFNMISVFGTGDPRTLSGGISEALITTEWGLLVSIPALLVHAVLSRKVKGILGSMEQLSVGFINGIPEKEEDLAF